LFTSSQIRKTGSKSIEKKKNTELTKTIRPEKNKTGNSIAQNLPALEKENPNKNQPKDKKKAKNLSQEIIDQ